MLETILAGLLLGAFSSVPATGPASVLVVSRAFAGRSAESVRLGIGAGLAEGFYAGMAFLGVGTVLAASPEFVPISRAIATVILAGVAVVLLRTRFPEAEAGQIEAPGRSFLLGLVVSGLNPALLLAWSMIVGMLASSGYLSLTYHFAGWFGLSVAVGVAGWFYIASRLIDALRVRATPEASRKVQRVMVGFVVMLALICGVTFVESLP